MFQSARLTLTAWYLLILMLISIVFSGVIYSIVSTQIQGLIHRQNEQLQHYREKERDRDDPPLIPIEELQDQKGQLLFTLISINGVILIVAGGAAYFLAGRTLRPIKEMIDEQNQFISSASHELRTPIATMRTEMETSMLERHLSDKRAREVLSSNLEELQSLQGLTNNLLTLAHVHNVGTTRFADEVSISGVLQTAVKKVLPLAKKKQIVIHQSIEDAIVSGDKTSLVEACVILLENAVKYSQEKSSITVSSKKTRHTVLITVQDQGIGIKAEDLPHIFERFYRADKARGHEGFGLGLSIAKKTIETHKGSIKVKSMVGKGTTFFLSLPLQTS